MAYAQWVSMTIKSSKSSDLTLTVKNIVSQWGKFYSGSKDNEVQANSINGTQIPPGGSYTISACGRSDAASGTEGSFDLYDGINHVGTFSWDCPWGSKTNSWLWSPASQEHLTQVTGANLYGGALGDIDIKVAKL